MIAATREGSAGAYAELWKRHADAATAYARTFARIAPADDLVSESFARILGILRRGKGPTDSFRSYLLTVVKNTAMTIKTTRDREQATDDFSDFEGAPSSEDLTLEGAERSAATRAFRSLPTRWQQALWYSEIEQLSREEIATILGIKANAVSALTFRARDALRTAWIQAHLEERTLPDECRRSAPLLGGYIRESLARRDRRRVEEHLEGCDRCRRIVGELDPLRSRLPALALIVLFGGIGGGAAVFGAPVDGASAAEGGGPDGASPDAGASPDGTSTGGTSSVGAAAGEGAGLIGAAALAAGVLVAAAAAVTVLVVVAEQGSREHVGAAVVETDWSTGRVPRSLDGVPVESPQASVAPAAPGAPVESPAAPAPEDAEERPSGDGSSTPESPAPAPRPSPPAPTPPDPIPSPTPPQETPPSTPVAPTVSTVDFDPSGWLLPSASGLAEPDAVVTVSANGVPVTTVIADAQGRWAVDMIPLEAGDWMLTARQAVDGRSSEPVTLGTTTQLEPSTDAFRLDAERIAVGIERPVEFDATVECAGVTRTVPAGGAWHVYVVCEAAPGSEVRVRFRDPATSRWSAEASIVAPA